MTEDMRRLIAGVDRAKWKMTIVVFAVGSLLWPADCFVAMAVTSIAVATGLNIVSGFVVIVVTRRFCSRVGSAAGLPHSSD